MFTVNSINVNRAARTIELTKKFDKAASRYGTEEYIALQNVRNDYPDFRIVVKSSNSKRGEHYNGLTYDFMERYIKGHDNADENLALFNDLRATSEEAAMLGAVAASYGEIKAWFFKTYPEIEAFQKRRENAVAA